MYCSDENLWEPLDAFGYLGMPWDALRCLEMPFDVFGNLLRLWIPEEPLKTLENMGRPQGTLVASGNLGRHSGAFLWELWGTFGNIGEPLIPILTLDGQTDIH